MTAANASIAQTTIVAAMVAFWGEEVFLQEWNRIHHPNKLCLATIGERLARIEEFTAKLRDMDFYHGPVSARANRVRNGVASAAAAGQFAVTSPPPPPLGVLFRTAILDRLRPAA